VRKNDNIEIIGYGFTAKTSVSNMQVRELNDLNVREKELQAVCYDITKVLVLIS